MNYSFDSKGIYGRLVRTNNVIHYLRVIGLLLPFLFLSFSCTDDEIQIVPIAQLHVEDISVTEVRLRVSMSEGGGNFALKRNDDTLIADLHSPIDTVIYDTGLLPKYTYTYKAGKGTPLTVTTMDTTSHNFTWHIDRLGYVFSRFYDIAIINDTLAYAVGEVYNKDSSGKPETQPYGLARWNGHDWKLIKAPYTPAPNAGAPYPGPLYTLFAFDENHIIVTQGSHVMWYNGEKWSKQEWLFNHWIDTTSGGINKIWGISPNQIWAVGNKGTIFYSNGSGWRKLERITNLNLRDIWGAYNENQSSYEILAVASIVGTNNGSMILQINENTISSISIYPVVYAMESMWFVPNRHYYIGGGGIYEKRTLSEETWKDNLHDIMPFSITGISGNTPNDVIFTSHDGDCVHYNGLSYKKYYRSTQINGVYTNVRFLGNLVIAVGDENGQACALIGRR